MIGKKVLFIRTEFDAAGNKVERHVEYPGIVLDKVRVPERIEGRIRMLDKYKVELANGIIGEFYPREAIRIIVQKDSEKI